MPAWTVRFDLPLDLRDRRVVLALSRAEALSQVLDGLPIPPPVRERLDRLNIARAVYGTTGIEGSTLSQDQVVRVLATDRRVYAGREREELETRNAGQAMDFIAERLTHDPARPVNEELVREVNVLLTGGLDYSDHLPGRYRGHGVSAGTYVAPMPDLVPGLMQEFIRWLNSGESLTWPTVARAVAAHFYLVSIHPFGDGNGRTSRAIESYLLYQGKINAFGFYSLANFYYRNRSEYIARLEEVRTSHDLTPMVMFAAEGMEQELRTIRREVLAYLQNLAFKDHARGVLGAQHLSSKTRQRYQALLDLLLDAPAEISSVRGGAHAISGLYARGAIRTFERDVATLERLDLIVRDGGILRLKLEALQP